MGDLNAKRGRVQGTDSDGDGRQTVIALVPTSEIQRYAIELRSLTGGRGRFHAQHDHYDVLPTHLVDAVRREVGDEAWRAMDRCAECGFDPADVRPQRPADGGPVVRAALPGPSRAGSPARTSTRSCAARPGQGVWSALEYGGHVADIFRTFDDRVRCARGPRARRGRDRLGGAGSPRPRRRCAPTPWPTTSTTRPTRSPPPRRAERRRVAAPGPDRPGPTVPSSSWR